MNYNLKGGLSLQQFEIQDDVLIRYLGHDSCPTIPEGIRVIGEKSFQNCSELQELILPEGIEKICAEAFQWCRNLTAVTAPDSLLIVERDAFNGTPYYKFYSENETD